MAADERDTRARDRIGHVLNDKWTLESLLGMGGMAAVYGARHRNGARAAVKVLHPDIARIPELRQRFLREGYAANKVEHPGAVKVQDDDVVTSGPDQDAAFLVMELLEGTSLEERIRKGPPIDERELLSLLRALLDVLEVAHAAGVVHRDLKPENVFLLKPAEGADPAKPKVKILDFGLARLSEGRHTIAGLAIGTPSYMPPEQAAGRVVEIDHRADLFALGATAFRILAGRTVHPAPGPMEIVLKMAKEPAPALRSVAPKVSAGVAAVVDRALAFCKEDRFADAAEMRAAVDEALADLDRGAAERSIELSLTGADVVIASTRSAPPPAGELAAFVARPTVLASAPPRPAAPAGEPSGVDSILQRLDLAPRPLRQRWRIMVVGVGAWAAIGVGLALEPARAPTESEAKLPLGWTPAPPPSTGPSASALRGRGRGRGGEIDLPVGSSSAGPRPSPRPLATTSVKH